ncbi:PREDICTED: chymotrypsinogen B2-like [Condylura cristata]|uniref:chymotrypsinogen B2-like n=1 Tax=Condylura cristata TaxID=143302 RepID=UPI0003344F85|nr:PREDICTED: chymotrypsinogen B2-like [Condylura cristata]
MAFVCLLSCLTLIGLSVGSGAPASDSELSITPRIINGKDARPGDWPWHVSLLSSSGNNKCGGSLIDRFWVITAAHCNITTSDRVMTGMFDLNGSYANVEFLRIAQVFTHPFFNLTTVYSDIALLKLDTPARFHQSVSPVTLPSFHGFFLPGTRCKIVGLGYLYPNSRVRPNKLQEATVPLHSVATCRKFWPNFSGYAMVCAGFRRVSFYIEADGSLLAPDSGALVPGSVSWDKAPPKTNIADNVSARGDSGGSLVCRKNRKWTLVGVLSFFGKYNPTEIPFVATRVSKFRPWIDDIMSHN